MQTTDRTPASPRRTARRAAGLVLALATTAAAVTAAAPAASAHEITGPLNGETRAALAGARAATAQYHDLDRALADGFEQGTDCVSNPTGPGAMGVHYYSPARLATGFEPDRPEVLIYEPQDDGRMRLVGVEYVVFDADQDPATDERPVFPGGISFHAPHAGPGPVTYTLHAYLWKNNPEGIFVDYNPRNSCG